jgi:DNA-binding transcriptional regulator GbsR (MarR family)
MDEERQRYVEEFGLLFEGYRLTRMVGRVLGLLLISDPPERTAEELAAGLRASRGSISAATRMLVRMGMVRKTRRPGERRDYFSVRQGSWMELTRQQMAATTVLREMAERGLELHESDDPESWHGLEEMRNFYAFWEEELPAALKRWEEARRKGKP